MGASTISTGLTNNFWVDSFILPLAITLLALWMLKSGMLIGVQEWVANRQRKFADYKASKQLKARILSIKRAEKN